MLRVKARKPFARLKHPNIASVYFVGQDNRICYMAMEHIEGVSLLEILDRLARTTCICLSRTTAITPVVRSLATKQSR